MNLSLKITPISKIGVETERELMSIEGSYDPELPECFTELEKQNYLNNEIDVVQKILYQKLSKVGKTKLGDGNFLLEISGHNVPLRVCNMVLNMACL